MLVLLQEPKLAHVLLTADDRPKPKLAQVHTTKMLNIGSPAKNGPEPTHNKLIPKQGRIAA